MEIPKYDELFVPIMELLKENGTPVYRKELVQPLAKQYNLQEEDINKKYPSGNAYIFEDRITWALSYLNVAGLLNKPGRGVYQLNDTGIKLLNNKAQIPDYIKNSKKGKSASTSNPQQKTDCNPTAAATPQEELYNSFEEIKESKYQEIISLLLSKSPRAFEEIVVLLLQKMGYGGKVKDAGKVTQYTNDGGIDGIIKEDILGFGRIHIQAKRYDTGNTVKRDEIQKFVGALAVAQSNKGVFITTSKFTQGAIDYANSLNNTTNIILIDGNKLAEYIYEYNLGVQTEQVLEIKKIDADFWDLLV